jgi:hypothetical protein
LFGVYDSSACAINGVRRRMHIITNFFIGLSCDDK